MKFTETAVPGAFTVDLEKRGDDRGFFARMYDASEFAELGLETTYVQFNTSFSRIRHTFRGMHYQLGTNAEVKLIKVIRGELIDFILDLRTDSPTFGRSIAVELSAENRTMAYVPRGCAHGFMSMTADVEMQYFVSSFYDPSAERCIRWNDPMFDITLPVPPAVISEKDASAPDFEPAWHLGRET